MRFVKNISKSLARRPRLGGAVAAVACLALLLWARLIVVSNMPRTAIAEEAEVEAQVPRSDTQLTNEPTDDAVEEIDKLSAEKDRSRVGN